MHRVVIYKFAEAGAKTVCPWLGVHLFVHVIRCKFVSIPETDVVSTLGLSQIAANMNFLDGLLFLHDRKGHMSFSEILKESAKHKNLSMLQFFIQ